MLQIDEINKLLFGCSNVKILLNQTLVIMF